MPTLLALPAAARHWRQQVEALLPGSFSVAWALHHLITPPPEPPVHLVAPAELVPRRTTTRSGRRPLASLSTTAGRSSIATNPRHGTLCEPTPLLRPFPAKPSLPSPELSSLHQPWRQGPNCNLSFRPEGLSAKSKDLFVKLFLLNLGWRVES
jgi:hypothetical protein